MKSANLENKNFEHFNKIFKELGPHLHDHEVNRILEFLYTIETSKYDINPTVTDAQDQIKLIIGSDRYEQAVIEWSKYNQTQLKEIGTKKYRELATNKIWDKLDETDDPNDFEVFYV